MASIRKHAKSNIRAKYDDIIVYNPSKKQVEELKELITNSLRLSNGEIQGDFGFDIIRKLIKDFTNIDNDEIDVSRFVKAPPIPKEEIVKRYNVYVESVQNEDCLKILKHFL